MTAETTKKEKKKRKNWKQVIIPNGQHFEGKEVERMARLGFVVGERYVDD